MSIVGPTGSIRVQSVGHGHAQGVSGQAVQQKGSTQNRLPMPLSWQVTSKPSLLGGLGRLWGAGLGWWICRDP